MNKLKEFNLNCHVLTIDLEEEVYIYKFDANSFDHAIEQAIDAFKDRSNGERLIKITTSGKQHTAKTALHQTGDNYYHLKPKTGSTCFITVGSINVSIKQEDEGVVIDLYSKNYVDRDSIATTYAFFSDAMLPEET